MRVGHGSPLWSAAPGLRSYFTQFHAYWRFDASWRPTNGAMTRFFRNGRGLRPAPVSVLAAQRRAKGQPPRPAPRYRWPTVQVGHRGRPPSRWGGTRGSGAVNESHTGAGRPSVACGPVVGWVRCVGGARASSADHGRAGSPAAWLPGNGWISTPNPAYGRHDHGSCRGWKAFWRVRRREWALKNAVPGGGFCRLATVLPGRIGGHG